jgi:hypothetical protein
MRFGFGQNWAKFIEHNFSEERVVLAQRHLMRFLRIDDLVGKTFVDIGCGSGIHSLGALRAGATDGGAIAARSHQQGNCGADEHQPQHRKSISPFGDGENGGIHAFWDRGQGRGTASLGIFSRPPSH